MFEQTMTTGSSSQTAAPHWIGPRYKVTVTASSEELAYKIAADKRLAQRFFLTDLEVNAGEVVKYLRSSALTLTVVRRLDHGCAGALLVTAVDSHSRQGFLSILAFDGFRGRLFFEAVILGIDAAFELLDLQRLRFDVVEFNLPQFSSVERWPGVDVEGVRLDWVFLNGRYWNAHMYSISRAGWQLRGAERAAALRRKGGAT